MFQSSASYKYVDLPDCANDGARPNLSIYIAAMKSIVFTLAAALTELTSAAPAELPLTKRALPTVYLAGDSTMALGGGGTGTQGKSLLS